MKNIKKILFVLSLFFTIGFMTSCSNKNASDFESEDRLVMISHEVSDYGKRYIIYADKETGVMYLFVYSSSTNGAGLIVMVDAEGKPLIWDKFSKDE